MKIPLFITMFLSEKIHEEQIVIRWDEKSDNEIKESYRSNMKWLMSLKKLWGDEFEADSLVNKTIEHLELRILPQMNNRNLNAYLHTNSTRVYNER